MTYSQKSLLEKFKAGEVPGENGVPKHIETVISNVFLFENTVYKIYKNDNEFFNKGFRDLSGKEDRFSFTRKDFEWNNALSPSIYTELFGAQIENGVVVTNEPTDESDELVFKMQRINQEDVLFDRLMHSNVTIEQCRGIGKQLAASLARVRGERPKNYNYPDRFKKRIDDIRSWIANVPEYIDPEEQATYCDYLEAYLTENYEWFAGELNDEPANGGDIHSMNAVLVGDTFMLMDSYAPKDEWMVDHELNPFYRVGTDIWALTGKREYFEAFADGYEEGSGKAINRRLDNVYIIYSASIMVSYLYMLQKTDSDKKVAAEQYHKFIRQYHGQITT